MLTLLVLLALDARPRQAPPPPQAPPVRVVRVVPPTPAACPCSSACTCGCQSGAACGCAVLMGGVTPPTNSTHFTTPRGVIYLPAVTSRLIPASPAAPPSFAPVPAPACLPGRG